MALQVDFFQEGSSRMNQSFRKLYKTVLLRPRKVPGVASRSATLQENRKETKWSVTLKG